jgi:tetratricopeptide (TPR) repeat protein
MMQATSVNETDATDKASVRAMVLHAEQALERSEFELALALAQRAERRAHTHDDQHLRACALLICARAEWALGRTSSSYAHAVEAYSMLGACGDSTQQLQALSLCAWVLNSGGDRARSIKLFQQGLSFAHEPDRVFIRCQLLRNLAVIFGGQAEYIEALACLTEAIALSRDVPELRGQWVLCANEEAVLRLQYAGDLKSRGQTQAALMQRQAAVEALPPISYAAWRTLSRREMLGLRARVRVLAELKRFAEARHVAAICLLSDRRAGRRGVVLLGTICAVAFLYRACGDIRRAIRAERRAVKCCEHLPHAADLSSCMHRMAQDYAQLGEYAGALACRREMAGLITRQRLEAAALRSRLAAIERQAERQRYRANAALVHTQRLAVIGRLIAQTHHALSAPAERVLALARKAQALSGGGAVLAEVKPVLDEISRTIDQAGALVSQLKLFSYRSTPQPMALSLREALRSAWQGLAPHLGAGARLAQLEVQDDAQHLQAWGDAQRLGIMLKLLLIELTQQAAAHDEPVMIRAYIESGGTAGVVLHLQAPRRAGTPLPDAQPTQTPAPALATLGVTLCQEIAGEMGGALDVQTQLQTRAGALLRYRLRLPGPDAQARELPRAWELR